MRTALIALLAIHLSGCVSGSSREFFDEWGKETNAAKKRRQVVEEIKRVKPAKSFEEKMRNSRKDSVNGLLNMIIKGG